MSRGSRVVLRRLRQRGLYLLQGTTIAGGVKDQRLWYSDTNRSSKRVTFAKDTVFQREAQRVIVSETPCVGVKARSGRPTLQATVSACRAAEEGDSPSHDQSPGRHQVRDRDPTRFRRNLVGALRE